MKCSKCGIQIHEAAAKGRYFTRTSPLGEPFVGECRPSCEYGHDPEDPWPPELKALVGAIQDRETENDND